MAFGDRTLERGMEGDDVVELQIRLAGFRGTVPDGDFGPGTELQVVQFQRNFLEMVSPLGRVDVDTLRGIADFGARYPIDFDALRCPCGECDGFGQGRFRGEYRTGKPSIEAYHRYEYPGIHRMILWGVRGAFHYASQYDFAINSGYRCGIRNEQKGRTSTNHHGKAIDIDVPNSPGEDRRDDMRRCDEIRGLLVEHSSAQIAWNASNRKALEPSNIAPTWVHYDVRCYAPRYLEDSMFCKTAEDLDGEPGGLIAESRSSTRGT